MKRSTFIKLTSMTITGALLHPNSLFGSSVHTPRMPVLFMGHGSPMNAIEDNAFTKGWAEAVKGIPSPKAILVVSAHWETVRKTKVFSGVQPKMIYDMSGFPKALYEVRYEVEGQPQLAQEIHRKIHSTTIETTEDWGLDHGAWSVLVKMFPQANIPCFQLSLNTTRDLNYHYELGKELGYLRDQGVLIVASGNIVHNLRYAFTPDPSVRTWTQDFDLQVADAIQNKAHEKLIDYKQFGQAGLLSVNSGEHYVPLLYALGAQRNDDEVTFINHEIPVDFNAISMRCLKIG